MIPRELHIIFTAESVRAILENKKTQTRRLMNPQPMPFVQQTPDRHQPKHSEPYLDAYCDQPKTAENPRGMGRSWHWWTRDDRPGGEQTRSRFLPGDVLWVKEAWRTEELEEMEHGTELPPGTDGIRFRADDSFRVIANTQAASEAWCEVHRRGNAWRPPLYMPRWASRISLEVTEVRAQRVQDISEEDAKAEGVDPYIGGEGPVSRNAFYCEGGFHNYDHGRAFRHGFEFAWDSINGKRSPWSRNDFVFAYTFRRVEK